MLATELAGEGLRASGRDAAEPRELTVTRYPGVVEAAAEGTLVVLTYGWSKVIERNTRGNEVQFSVFGRRNDALQNLLHLLYQKSGCLRADLLTRCEGGVRLLLSIDIRIIEGDGLPYAPVVAGVNDILQSIGPVYNFLPRIFAYASIAGLLVGDPDAAELAQCDWHAVVGMKSPTQMMLVEKTGGACGADDVARVVEAAYSASAGVGQQANERMTRLF